MKQPLTIVHNPPGYKLEVRLSEFEDKELLAERHMIIRTGELGAIALNKQEVKQLIAWLLEWVSEEGQG